MKPFSVIKKFKVFNDNKNLDKILLKSWLLNKEIQTHVCGGY
jgi:hypothetical protein